MTWLSFVLAFQLGWYPLAQFQGYEPPTGLSYESGQFYQQTEAKMIILSILEIGGKVIIHDWKLNGGFCPDGLDSVLFANILLGPFTVGWQHECIHPVVPWHINPSFDAASDQIYARVELRWDWK